MLSMTNSNIDNNITSPFYYIAHPYEAYKKGYNTFLGEMNDSGQIFDAYTYYLPMEVVKWLPPINEYFNNLILGGPLNCENRRRTSYLESIDTAVEILTRITFLNQMGRQVAVGSRHIDRPITWAVFGIGIPASKMYTHQFYTIDDVIIHYNQFYKNPVECQPICVYHKQEKRTQKDNQPRQESKGRTAVNNLCALSTKFSTNSIITAAVHLLVDMITHGGPDTTDFFDLYTNDLTRGPHEVNLDLWKKCRNAIVRIVMPYSNYEPPEQTRKLTYVYSPPPPPAPPKKVKITITDEGDDLSKGVKTTKFQSITIVPPTNNYFFGD